MKYLLLILLLFFKHDGNSQNIEVRLDITIIDTAKPYFLNILLKKGNVLAKKITVITSGPYFFKDIDEGDYSLEILSYQSSARRLNITNVHFYKDSANQLSITYPPPCKFNYSKNYKPQCPHNHSEGIVRIVYGYPTSKTMEKAKKGLVHLGGCMVSNCDPQYYCTIHKVEL